MTAASFFRPFADLRSRGRGAIFLAAAATCWVMASGPGASRAQSPAVADQPPGDASRYRRVFVPAERPDEWPVKKGRYLPMSREAFEELAAELPTEGRPRSPRISHARYEATLQSDQTLRGTATYRIDRGDNGVSLLNLTPLNLAVTAARWAATPKLTPELGLWQQPGEAAPGYAVRVSRSDSLELEWLCKPANRAGSRLTFQLKLPLAPSQQFDLRLPRGCTATIESARLEKTAPAGSGDLQLWTFRLPAGETVRLSVELPAEAGPSLLPTKTSVAEAYRVLPTGLDYDAEFRIESGSADVDELHLKYSDALVIMEVLVDRRPTEWRKVEPNGIAIPLSEGAARHTVRVRASGSMSIDAPWTLPKVVAEEAAWTEGATTIWIDPTLELQSITPRGASLLNAVGVGAASNVGEAFRLQNWSSAGGAELKLAMKKAALSGRVSTVVEFADRGLAARTRAVLASQQGEVFQLSAEVAADWIVESLEIDAEYAPLQWHVAKVDGGQRLFVELPHAPTASKPLTLTASGRKPVRRVASSASLSELLWLKWNRIDGQDNLLLVKDRSGGKVTPSLDALEAVVPFEQLADDRAFAPGNSNGVVIATARATPDARFRLASQAPRFDGQCWAQLIHTGSDFQQVVDVQCQPISGALNEATVIFSRKVPENAAWELVGSSAALSVQQIETSSEGSPAAASDKPSEYRVQFPRPMNEEFRLRINWRVEGADEASVNAAIVAGAEAWQSWAVLRARPETVEVDPQGCPPTVANPLIDDRSAMPIVGCFRLGGDATAAPESTPVLRLASQLQVTKGGVFCWHVDVATVQQAAGEQLHRLKYNLEVQQAEYVDVNLPQGVRLAGATFQGEPAAVEGRGQPGAIRIQIPPNVKHAQLEIDCEGRRAALGRRAAVEMIDVASSFKVLRGTWTVYAPPVYEIATGDRREGTAFERLFGPLAEARGATSPLARAETPTVPEIGAGNSDRPSDTREPLAPLGWPSWRQEFSGSPAPVQLVLADASRATWHAMWVVSAVLAALLWSRRRAVVLAASAVAAVGALVAPATDAELFQSAFLGVLSGLAARLVLGPRQLPATGAPSAAAALAMVCFLTGIRAPVAWAADPSATAPPSVLIPIDGAGRPSGPDVYVPESLLGRLLEAENKNAPGSTGIVLREARCSIVLQREAASGEVVCESCTLSCSWLSFRDQARVSLPLHENEASWLASRHTLNGSPVLLDWESDGVGATVRLGEAGVHELRLHLIPEVTNSATKGALRLHVPPLPGMTLDISHPADLKNVEVADGVHLPKESASTRWVARLPGAPIVEASWTNDEQNGRPGISVDQLTSMRIDRASAQVEVQLHIKGEQPTLDAIEIEMAPHLKLLPLADDSVIGAVEALPGDPATVRLRFRGPQELPLRLSLPFQLQRTVSIGRIEYPGVRVRGAKTELSYFIAEVDPTLRVREEVKTGLTPIPISEIEQGWDAAAANATLQYSVEETRPEWSILVEPSDSPIVAQEALNLLCDRDEARLHYAATFGESDQHATLLEFSVSPELLIRNVAVQLDRDENAVPFRWSRPRPDVVAVFLERPLLAGQTVSIHAAAKYVGQSTLSIPRIKLRGASPGAMDIAVRRTLGVLVDWVDAAPPAPALEEVRTAAGDEGRLVGRYSLPAAGEAPVLRVIPNSPQWSGAASLRLDASAEPPAVELHLVGRVSHGALDRVRLAVSSNWSGPFVVEPSGALTILPGRDDSRQQIIDVGLPAPVMAGDEFQLRLRGPLAVETDRRVRIPNVRIAGAGEAPTYLLLPNVIGRQSIEWTLSGLIPEQPPAALRAQGQQSAGSTSYRVVRDNYVAEQRTFPEEIRTPTALVEARAAIDAAGNCSVVVDAIVQPGDATECSIGLPEGAELLFAAVNDRPVDHPQLVDGIWTAPGGPRFLPRIFTLGYHERLGPTGPWKLAPIRVVVGGRPVAVESRRWQISTDGRALRPSVLRGREITYAAFAQSGYQKLSAMATAATPLVFQLPEWEARSWFQPWLDRLPMELDGEAPWARFRTLTDDSVDRFAADASHARWYETAANGDLVLHAPPTGTAVARWLLALAIAGGAFAAYRYQSMLQPVGAALGRVPQIAAFAVGAVWWMFLSPAFVGLVIAGLALASLVRIFQRTAADEASQIVYLAPTARQ